MGGVRSGRLSAEQFQTRDLRVKLDTAAARNAVPVNGTHGFWSNPLTATLMVVGGIALIGLLADSTSSNDDDEGAASPF